MSMKLMVQAMNLPVGNPTTKLVLLKLADNANDDGTCFPSYQTIAKHCEISRQTAITHIDKLIEMGYVSKFERKTDKGNTSNLYILHLDNKSVSKPSKKADPVKDFDYPSQNPLPRGSQNSLPRTSKIFNQSINHNPLPPNGEVAKATDTADFSLTEKSPPAKTNSVLDYAGIGIEFNNAIEQSGVPIPKIRNPDNLSDDRKRKIKSLAKFLYKEFGKSTPDVFRDYFDDFIQQARQRPDNFYFGGGQRGWIADFDFVFRTGTLNKTLEESL